MERKSVLRWLNWFYSLEIQQYELYENQFRRSKDEYIAKVLNHVSEVEHGHAHKLANQIKYLGANLCFCINSVRDCSSCVLKQPPSIITASRVSSS